MTCPMAGVIPMFCVTVCIIQLRTDGHCAYKCEYYLVIVTKYRCKIFQEGSFNYFHELRKAAPIPSTSAGNVAMNCVE